MHVFTKRLHSFLCVLFSVAQSRGTGIKKSNLTRNFRTDMRCNGASLHCGEHSTCSWGQATAWFEFCIILPLTQWAELGKSLNLLQLVSHRRDGPRLRHYFPYFREYQEEMSRWVQGTWTLQLKTQCKYLSKTHTVCVSVASSQLQDLSHTCFGG